MSKRYILWIVTLFLLSSCSKPEEKEAEAPQVRTVTLGEIKRESIDRVIMAEGVLFAKDQSAVTAKFAAPISRILVNRGDHVEKGQLIAVLESRDLAASVNDTKGALEQAAATYRNISAGSVPEALAKAQADVSAAQQTMEAALKLRDSRQQLYKEGALARRLVDEADVQYAQAKSTHDTARQHLQSVQNVTRLEDVATVAGQLESAKGKHEAAQVQLAYSQVYSPLTGVVAERPVYPGELASPGAPIAIIMDISRVIARVHVPQDQIPFVRLGQAAQITGVDGALAASGRVTVISPALDPQGTTVEVWVEAANPGEKLRPGGAVRVAITADAVRNAIVVPASALVQSSSGGSSVMVVGADRIAHEKPVQTGLRVGDKVQILEGVDSGDKVVLSGNIGLADGATVALTEKK